MEIYAERTSQSKHLYKILKMLLLLLLLLLLILCVYPCVYVHVCFGAWGGQSNIWDSVSLGLQVVGSSLMWLLGIEFWFSDRAASTLKHGTILQTFIKVILKKSISSLTQFAICLSLCILC